jgi:outer membrane protein TolC
VSAADRIVPARSSPRAAQSRFRSAVAGTLALSWLLLAACASYQPAPLAPERSAAEFNARRLDSPDLRERVAALLPDAAAVWPPAAWDRAHLLAVAMVWNPKIAVARAEAEAALAHETTAGQRPNPELTLQSEYARKEPHPWLYGLGLQLLLQQPERRRVEADIARLETSAARRQLMDQAWSVRSALLDALSERESARRRLELLGQILAGQDRLLDLMRRRVAAGEDAAGDLLPVTQARIEIEQQQAQARSELAAADAALAAALGVAPAALDGVRIDWPDWGEPPEVAAAAVAEAREQALRARSDLGAALDAYAAAEGRLHRAVLQQYPQVNLSPGYYWDHGIAKFPLDAAFELPLFHRNEGEIAEARAAREVAGRRMLAVQAGIIGAIAAAEHGEGVARDSVAAAERSLEAARNQRRNSALNLRLGAIGANEDVAAAVVALRGELETLQMRARWQAARNALEAALHAPLSGPELQMAQRLPDALGAAR